jgi:large subunit ribosomal protein L25
VPDDIVLTAEPRSVVGTRPAGRLRREGKVPAVVYGLDTDTIKVTVPARELQHILAGEAGANALITLKCDGDDMLTLARQIQRHPTRGDLVHVDFVRIRRDVAVQAEIPVHLEGEPAGVRDGGVLEQLVFSLTIEAKPADIPNAVEVDVSALEIGSQMRIEELDVPAAVTVLHEPDEIVVQVAMPRVVEEPEPTEEGEEIEGEAPEGEVAEGEAPAEGGGDAEGESGGE